MEPQKALQDLQKSAENYKTLLNSIDAGFCIFELLFDENEQPIDYRFLEINPKFEEQTGLKNALGKTARELVPGLEQHWFDTYGKVALTGEPLRFVNHAENMNSRWFDVYACRFGGPESRKVAVIFTDITARKLAEERLVASEERNRLILESITDAFLAFDSDWRYIYINPQAEQLLDKKSSELIGQSLWEVYPGMVGSEFEKLYHQVAAEKISGTLTSYYPDHDRWYEVHAYPAQNDGITVYFQNATSRIRVEEELRNKNHELEQFAYVASHDLQEPVNTIKSFIELMKEDENTPPAFQEYLAYMNESAVRMTALIRDLLAHSRIGNENDEKAASVDFGRIVTEVIADLQGLVKEKEAAIQTGPLPTLRAYPLGIRMLFQNLLTNALKFQREGVPPVVHIAAVEEDLHWHFTVADNGIGIADKYSEKIFKMFQRLHTKEDIPGTGIGLAQCRKIVGQHRGRIWMEPALGAGSVFHFTIDKWG